MSYLSKIFFFILLPLISLSQKWEVGLQFGPSNYQGDLASDISILESKISGGMFLKKNVNQFFSHSINILEGEISGNDKNFKNQKIRNLSFQSSITELSYQLDFNFFPFSFGLNHKDFTPYVFSGLALFYFNPQAIYDGKVVDLNKLDTEGKVASNQKKNGYSQVQLSIPLGGGFKYSLNDKFIIGFNVGFRSAFTDYLDDVSTTYYDKSILLQKKGNIAVALSDRSGELSANQIGFNGKQRGRSDMRDWYIFSGIFISYKIRDSVCFEF
jgi:hypothetical protein